MGRSENEEWVGNLQNNVEVPCSSLQESCRFYSLALGFPIISRDSERCVLDGGGHRLTLRAQGPADTTVRGKAQTGVSIEVERIFETFEKLVSDGVEFSSRPCCQPWGSIMVNAHDPDGNRIMLIQRRSTARDWRQAPLAGDAMAA